MVAIVGESDDGQLLGFFDYIYDNQEGYAYVARKVPVPQTNLKARMPFQQEFFSWPSQKDELVAWVLQWRPTHEVYFAPALFSAPSSLKDHFQSTRVFWLEFDGKVPTDEEYAATGLPAPTLRVSTSEGHEHWYWKTDHNLDQVTVERVNRAMTYKFGADASGWDVNQVLRPILTFNHKRQTHVSAYKFDPGFVTPDLFVGLAEPPPVVELQSVESIPDVQEVVFGYKFTDHVMRLFRAGAPVGKRSVALMSLGYYLAEMNLTNEEIFAMLLNADDRWGKFAGRSDQHKRLLEIVTIARVKFPWQPTSETLGVPVFEPMGFITLLRSTVHIEWIWEGWLAKQGYMLLTGPSAVGKTQLTLDTCISMVLGQHALDRPTKRARIGFFSLEMSLPEIKVFAEQMAVGLTEEEAATLEQDLLMFPMGEPLYLTNIEVRQQVEQLIGDLKLDGVVFDSMGSTTDGTLSDEVSVKKLIDWNDRLRVRTGAFTWYIHHHRKANGDNRKPNKLADVYGNQYITARATSVICLWPGGVVNQIEVLPLKVRLQGQPPPFLIKRGPNLRYTRMVNGIVQEESQPIHLEGVELDTGPVETFHI